MRRMAISRRSFVSGSVAFAAVGSIARVIGSASHAHAQDPRRHPFRGYGELVPGPHGFLDLPKGFQYAVFSRAGDPLTRGGLVPASHDGMAAFGARAGSCLLVRNHELESEDVLEEGKIAVEVADGATYDPEAYGGTTTLHVSRDRRLLRHEVSLAGTDNNCAGGPTPWQTWLTCEETYSILSKPHGYVFEVDPRRGGNPEPIVALGRFEHEAIAFDRRGVAYLTEDAGAPFGCFYRFQPANPLGGRGSLHGGGSLAALVLAGLSTDLSIVQEPGTVLPVSWVPVPNPNPGAADAKVREQVQASGATPIQKAEGVWTGVDGSIWFVCSYGGGPDAEDEEDRSAAGHSGQIWRFDPSRDTLELVTLFPLGSPFDGPDNITAGPHGFAVACTDGEDDQWLVAIADNGAVFPLALNTLNESEFAGATFSPNGETLFVNIQDPGLTLAIWGPW
jgi:uncharacterized protein